MTDDPILAALERLVVGQDVLTAGQEALAAGQARLADGQDRLRMDLMARMDQVRDALTEVRDDIAVNMARAIRRTKRPIRTRQDTRLLSEQVATMERQIRRLEARVREITGDP
jgi:hypothetical protein